MAINPASKHCWADWDQNMFHQGPLLVMDVESLTEKMKGWELRLHSCLELFNPESQSPTYQDTLNEIQKDYSATTFYADDPIIQRISARINLDPMHSPSSESLNLIVASQDITLDDLNGKIKALHARTNALKQIQNAFSKAVDLQEQARYAFEYNFNFLIYCIEKGSNIKLFFNPQIHFYIERPRRKKIEIQDLMLTLTHRATPWNHDKMEEDYVLSQRVLGLNGQIEFITLQLERSNATVQEWYYRPHKVNATNVEEVQKECREIDFKEMDEQYQKLKADLKERIDSDCKETISNLAFQTLALANDITIEEIKQSLEEFKKQTTQLKEYLVTLEKNLKNMNLAHLTVQESWNIYSCPPGDLPACNGPLLPFKSINDLTEGQKNCIYNTMEILWHKMFIPHVRIEREEMFLATLESKDNIINKFLNLVQFYADVYIPPISEMTKGRDSLLNDELDEYVKKLDGMTEELKKLQERADEIHHNFQQINSLFSARKPDLDRIREDYGKLRFYFDSFDRQHGDLITKIQLRINEYIERKISHNSKQLVINIVDADLNYLQKNLKAFEESTKNLRQKIEEIKSKKSTFEANKKAFDRTFNLLCYVVDTGAYHFLTLSTFNVRYAKGDLQALHQYAPQSYEIPAKMNPLYKKAGEELNEVIMEVLTNLAQKILIIEGDELSPPSCKYPPLLLVHYWTPCFNDVKQKKDKKLNWQVNQLIKRMEVVQSPHGEKAHKAMTPELEAISKEFTRLKKALEERIGLQIKPTISERALKLISLSHDFQKRLQEMMTIFSENTESFQLLSSQLDETKSRMNKKIQSGLT